MLCKFYTHIFTKDVIVLQQTMITLKLSCNYFLYLVESVWKNTSFKAPVVACADSSRSIVETCETDRTTPGELTLAASPAAQSGHKLTPRGRT